jgi:ASC-1-like (ASCH) protein
VWLREDVYENGVVIRSTPRQVLVSIKKIETYPDFKTMLEKTGFKNTIPKAKTLQEAIDECCRFYKSGQERQCGVLAIYFEAVKLFDLHEIIYTI